jgi:hypothetical protein
VPELGQGVADESEQMASNPASFMAWQGNQDHYLSSLCCAETVANHLVAILADVAGQFSRSNVFSPSLASDANLCESLLRYRVLSR